MAQEIKNTFLKAKMNKDLDDRVIPNGEYRDALNVSVGKSEADNVGSLENILGNILLGQTNLGDGYEIIGFLEDSTNDKIYTFVTNYTDPNPDSPTDAPSSSEHYIYVYDAATDAYNLLVSGNFLNFSTTNRIIGVNLIEQLLFWTDDRNQPRKINVELALRTVIGGGGSRKIPTGDNTDEAYYTKEHQISVAKYAPYEVITMYNSVRVVNLVGNTAYISIEGDRLEEMEAFIGATVVSAEDSISGNDFITVLSVNLVGGDTRIAFSPALQSPPTADAYYTFITSTMSNESDNAEWPGDPDYLEDRFARFSYRFKYDDNEYSLMAPFTQVAFIPKQKGYWINGQQEAAAKSTVVDWFENEVQNIKLNIPLPTRASGISNDYKIAELEILFRESDSVAVKVLESVSASEVAGVTGTNNVYTYDYQSRKPYRTLAEAQTVRVYDKVPVRAQSQETSGNRVIYGNYRDMHTPPALLNYNCRIARKNDTSTVTNFIEYPNHTLKRNRNYQVGFVLSDKFGRTSPVILSNIDKGTSEGGLFFSGSTIYSPYDANELGTPDIMKWFGDAIEVVVNEPIKSTKNQSTGTPGLYAVKLQRDTSAEGFAINSFTINSNTGCTFELNTSFANNANVPDVGDYLRGEYSDFVVVETVNTTDNITYSLITEGRVSDSYLRTENLPGTFPDLKFAYRINDLGWYSYKVVVKQTEQEYYNVYTAGILNGYPGQAPKWYIEDSYEDANGNVQEIKKKKVPLKFPTDEQDVTAHVALFNDNINKVPRDLAEVGPDQKQYRSSVVLYGRVTNTMVPPDGFTWDLNSDGGEPAGGGWEDAKHLAKSSNVQYYPRTDASGILAVKHVATQIANARDFNMSLDDLSASAREVNTDGSYDGLLDLSEATGGQDVFYTIESNPLIAKISTAEKGIGWTNTRMTDYPNNGRSDAPTQPQNMWPFLAIYETAPVESNLDIYWETASTGLIVDLNTAISSTAGGAVAFENLNWNWDESMTPGTRVTPATGGSFGFEPLDPAGNPYPSACVCTLTEVIDGTGRSITGMFELVETSQAGQYQINYEKDYTPFIHDSSTRDVYTFLIQIETPEGFIDVVPFGGEEGGIGALKNIAPTFSAFTPTNIDLAGNDSVVIDIADYNDVSNGSFNSNGLSTQEIRYTMEGINGTVIPGAGAGEWTIDNATGKITCNPGETPQGTYQLRITITDANDQGGLADVDYAPLTDTQDITVYLGYSSVNPSAMSSLQYCTVDPAVNVETDNVVYLDGNSAESEINAIWYVSKNGIVDFDLGTNSYRSLFAPNGDTRVVHLGDSADFGSHERGTIVFDVNWKMAAGTNALCDTGTVYMYYRQEGTSTWLPLDTIDNVTKEYNNAYLKAPFGNQKLVDSLEEGSSVQSVRAFDFLDFTSSEPIEYAILVKGLKWTSGATNGMSLWVGSDDLHYPSCVPRIGYNSAGPNSVSDKFAVSDQGTTPHGLDRHIYKYYRSALGANSQEALNINATGPYTLYAETPYSEYVNSFFLDQNLTTLYVPSNQNINNFNVSYQIDHEVVSGGIANVQWKDPETNNVQQNKVVLGIDDLGEKIKVQSNTELHAKMSTFTTTGQNVGADGSFAPTRFHNNL